MVVFIDRSVTIGSTPFEYNFGVNTSFYANIVNSTPGQASGPDVIMRVFAQGLGHQDVNVPYGTPIVQLGLLGNKVQFIGNGAAVAITLSSTPIPLSATDIGQQQLHAKGTVTPAYTYQTIPYGTGDHSTTPVALTSGTTVVVVTSVYNNNGNAVGGPTVSDSVGNTFTQGVSTLDSSGSYSSLVQMYALVNASAATDYTVTITGTGGANFGGTVVFFFTSVPTNAPFDFMDAAIGSSSPLSVTTNYNAEILIFGVAGATSATFGGLRGFAPTFLIGNASTGVGVAVQQSTVSGLNMAWSSLAAGVSTFGVISLGGL